MIALCVGLNMVFENQGRQIKICNSVLVIIKRHLQCDNKAYEAGGLLIGRENISNNNLILDYATEPLPGDKRSRHRFIRRDINHINFYKNLYKTHSGVYRYIGEWHTHPEACPSYSSMDLCNWKKIGKDSCDGTQIHMIAGYDFLRLWTYSYCHKTVSELITIKWEQLIKHEENI